MPSKEKPYVLLVAEAIYSKVCEIKKKNPELTTINAIENFIGTTTYNDISSGKFHDELIEKVSKKKVPEETLRLLHIQKDLSVKQLFNILNYIMQRAIILWNYHNEHSIIYGVCVKVMNYGVKRQNKTN